MSDVSEGTNRFFPRAQPTNPLWGALVTTAAQGQVNPLGVNGTIFISDGATAGGVWSSIVLLANAASPPSNPASGAYLYANSGILETRMPTGPASPLDGAFGENTVLAGQVFS